MQDVYKNTEEHDIGQKCKILTVFDDRLLIWLIKKLNPVVTELFIRGSKLHISIVLIKQSYFDKN